MAEYRILDYKTFKIDEDQQQIALANFTAQIVKETRTIDGIKTETVLTIHGQQPGERKNPNIEPKPIQLPEVVIDASEFQSFAWVMRIWGTRCVIYPGGSVKEDLRTAIQLDSKPEVREIFGTMGWQKNAKGNKMYLHAGGAIKADGNDSRVKVALPPELARFNLADIEDGTMLEEAFASSLRMIDLGPKEVMWPLWATIYAPVLGPVDFAVHLTGRSGTYKSEITSLMQAHFGGTIDARHLPASWSSTANALEAQAHFAANAIMVIDDFVPVGTSYQVKSYQTNADRLIRGQGNQAGRARLSDAASFKSAYYPRGLIVSTGEDTPEGHSVRARMLILELSPGDIDIKVLTEAQKKRGQLTVAMAGFIADAVDTVAPEIEPTGNRVTTDIRNRIDEIRDVLITIGHSRTPTMLARLIATVETVLQWAVAAELITEQRRESLVDEATQSIMAAGLKQASYLESADPVAILLNAIRQSLMSQHSHVRSMSGGVPTSPERLGWTAVNMSGEQTKYKAGGVTIGWIDWDEDTMYLEADLAYAAAKREAGQELTITKGTAWKRLKDSGALIRTDAGRQRNTVRVTADGHTRNVLAMRASDFFETKEVAEDGDEQHDEDDDGIGHE